MDSNINEIKINKPNLLEIYLNKIQKFITEKKLSRSVVSTQNLSKD